MGSKKVGRVSLQVLTDFVGVVAARSLVDLFPGIRLYIPKNKLSTDHPLVIGVGEENCQKIQKRFGGERIDIPRKVRVLSFRDRNKAIASSYKAGDRIADIALTHEVTESRIFQILKICGVAVQRKNKQKNTLRERNEKIVAACLNWQTPSAIARVHGLTETNVRNILSNNGIRIPRATTKSNSNGGLTGARTCRKQKPAPNPIKTI